jgi:hypothetical protein
MAGEPLWRQLEDVVGKSVVLVAKSMQVCSLFPHA